MSYILDRDDIINALGIQTDIKTVNEALKSFSGNIEAIKKVMESLKGQSNVTLNDLTESIKKVSIESAKFKEEQERVAKSQIESLKKSQAEQSAILKKLAAERISVLRKEAADEIGISKDTAAEQIKNAKRSAEEQIAIIRQSVSEKIAVLREERAQVEKENKKAISQKIQALEAEKKESIKNTRYALSDEISAINKNTAERKKALIELYSNEINATQLNTAKKLEIIVGGSKQQEEIVKKTSATIIGESKRVAAEEIKSAQLSVREKLRADKMASDRKKLLIQAMQAEKGSIEQLTAVNKVLQLQMAKLNATIPEQAAKYGKLQQAVVGNRNAMMQYAQSQMGVAVGSGKVKREFNGIQFQVTQLARELPALAYGPQMFIAAISNNFPMLQDEIKKVRIQNELLKKSGQATIPVWKNIAKSIFSLQTGVVVLITAYMLFNKEIHAAVRGLFSYVKAVDAAKHANDLFNKAKIEGIKGAQDEIVKLKVLTKYTQDNTLAYETRVAAAESLKKLFPDILGGYTAEEIITRELRRNYDKLTQSIYKKSKSDAAAKKTIDENVATYDKYLTLIDEEEEKLKKLNQSRSAIAELLKNDPTLAAAQRVSTQDLDIIDQEIEKKENYIKNLDDKMRAILKANETLLAQVYPNTFIDDIQSQYDKYEKKQEEFDNRLQMLKLQNEKELILLQTKQREEYLKTAEKLANDETKLESEKKDQLAELEAQQAVIYLSGQKSLNEKVIRLTKQIAKEKIAIINKEYADQSLIIDRNIDKSKADIEKNKEYLDEKDRAAEDHKLAIIQIQKETNEAILTLQNEQYTTSKDIADKAGEEQVANIERDAKIQEEKAKIIAELREKISDETIDYYFDEADAAILAAQDTTLAIIKDRKLRNREIEKLQRELALQEVRSNILAVRTMLDDKFADGTYKLTDKARADKENQLNDLMKRLKELQIENSKKGLEDDVEKWKEWADAVSQIVNEFFNLLNSLYENQLQVAKNLYESESKYAGVSVEQKLEAEKKLERREKAVKKKQAIAQKAQTIFNIVMNLLAHKSKGALGLPEMIVAGAAMATAIATPLPAFEDGGKHKKAGMAKVSEKGQEIFIDKKTGKMFLTPKNETIAHFPAGEFIPHDETQKMLANFAMTNNKEIIDMSKTNDYLSSIDRNTRNQTTVNIAGGYKIIVRNGITSKIRL